MGSTISASVYIYIYVCIIYLSIRTYVRLSLDPEGKARVQNGVSGSFWVPSSKSWQAQSQRSGQICHEVLSRETYYSSQVCRYAIENRVTTKREVLQNFPGKTYAIILADRKVQVLLLFLNWL